MARERINLLLDPGSPFLGTFRILCLLACQSGHWKFLVCTVPVLCTRVFIVTKFRSYPTKKEVFKQRLKYFVVINRESFMKAQNIKDIFHICSSSKLYR